MVQAAATDELLAERAAGGDREAVSELFNRYFDRIYDFSLGLVRSPDTAADVAQTTFLKVMEHLRRRPAPPAFRPWLYTIARHTAIDELRRSQRQTPVPTMGSGDEDDWTLEPAAPARWAEPERVTADQETVDLVWAAAVGLNPEDRALLDLNLRQGLDPVEIATVLGTAAGTVYTRLSRLRDALESSVSAHILLRRGRGECRDLSGLVERYGESMTANLRKAINRHLAGCDRCQESRRKFVAAGALYSAVPIFLAPPQLRADTLATLLDQFTGGSGGTPDGGPRSPGGGSATAPWVKAAAGVAAAAAVAGAAWWFAYRQPESPAATPPAASSPAPAPAPPAPSGPPAIIAFRLRDAAADGDGVARSADLAVETETTGAVTGWLITEADAGPPAPLDPRWQTAAPEQVELTPGDGRRTLYLWVRDAAGLTAVSASSILLDTSPPGPPAALQSPTHVLGRTTADNVITVTWAPATDAGSGLAGYAVAWDNPGEENPTDVNLGPEATRAVSPPLPPGRWYFLIRAVDRAGNAGPLARLGPFVVVASGTGATGPAPAPADTAPVTPVESPFDRPPSGEVQPAEPADPAGTPGPAPAPPADIRRPTAPAVHSFSLHDLLLGTAGLTSTLVIMPQAQVEGDIRAWLVAEDRPQAPEAGDPGWLPALPPTLTLAPGEGSRTVYLWVRDAAGQVAGAAAAVVVDTAPPGAVMELRSSTHGPGLAGGPGPVLVLWRPAADPEPGSGLAGYAVRWVSERGAVAGEQQLEADATTAASPALTPGEAWYFVIRARDRAGHLGPAVRVGPFTVKE